MVNIHPTADVSKKTRIGSGTKIWHQAQIMENVVIGENCIIGKGVFIDKDCIIGSNVKIQNYACIYKVTEISDDVFIGPQVIVANDKYPRSTVFGGKLKNEKDWKIGKTFICRGSSIGAGVILLPNLTIGEYSLIGAGSLVSKNINPHSLVYGNPCKVKGFVCFCGKLIKKGKSEPKFFLCSDHKND